MEISSRPHKGSTTAVSVVIIAKNEENNIERCVRSAQWAEEILVVDTDSTDSTRAIAEKCGARVIQHEWLGFGPQKAMAAKLAKNDWILSVDADEEIQPELASEIQKCFQSLNPLVAYKIPRKSWYMGRWIRHGGWYPDYQVRLFHRQHSMWNSALIHEAVESKSIAELQGELAHYVFKDISHQVATNNRYSTLLAEKDYKQGKRFSFLKMMIKPPIKFLECYFVKQGFRDGLAGFAIAVSAGYSVFLRWMKIWEMNRAPTSAAILAKKDKQQ